MSKRLPSGKVKSLEDRLDHFAFMRRAREKVQLVENAKQKAFKDEGEWTPSVQVSGCTVIVEGGADISVPTGRMSFLSFNPAIEKVQKELESHSRTLQQIRECGAEYRREMGSGAEISDLEMAKCLSKIDYLQSGELEKQEEELDAVGGNEPSFSETKAKKPRQENIQESETPARQNLIEMKMSKRCLANRFQNSSLPSHGIENDQTHSMNETPNSKFQEGVKPKWGKPAAQRRRKQTKKKKSAPLPQQPQNPNGVKKKKKKNKNNKKANANRMKPVQTSV